MIRSATPWDRTDVLAMLGRYKNHSPLEFHKHSSLEQAGKIFDHILAGAGICLVAEDSAGIHGMLMAIKNPNIWDPSVVCMNELAYWVNPERRGTTSGYRLLKMYVDLCKELKSQDVITYYTVSKMITSPNLDYGKFGFNKLEEMWSQ